MNYVGIDVETTSLNPKEGEIIEIAAIRYDESGSEVERFIKLTKPSKPIPALVQKITGISNKDVEGKPPFKEVAKGLAVFVGDDSIFAHNANFDLSWLATNGVNLYANNPIDTFLLASIAWPNASSYNLGTLAAEIGIIVTEEHRASSDVELTWLLLEKIKEKLAVEPKTLLLIEELLAVSGNENYLYWFREGTKKPNAKRSTSDSVQKEKISLEKRETQEEMSKIVVRAISEHETVLIEAPTGTGKTFAYLKPILEGKKTTPAIISTYTKNLQDQLFSKDIPQMMNYLGVEKRVAKLKGRNNYLCRARLDKALIKETHDDASIWPLIKILVWLSNGGNGDLSELNFSHQETAIQTLVSADHSMCREICSSSSDCWYEQAKQEAREAEIVIVNHAVLSRVLLDDLIVKPKVLVVDEGHHLEESIRDATKIDFSIKRLETIMDDLIVEIPKQDALRKRLQKEKKELLSSYLEIKTEVSTLVSKSRYANPVLLNKSSRTNRSWKMIAQLLATFSTRLSFIDGLAYASVSSEVNQVELKKFSIELVNFAAGSTERIQWLEKDGSLHDHALNLAPITDSIFSGSPTNIVTSATLATGDNFEYAESRLGLNNALYYKIDGGFINDRSMLLYLANNAPDPASKLYYSNLAKIIADLVQNNSGRSLILLNSHDAVSKIYNALIARLPPEAELKIHAQKVTGGRANVLNKFIKDENAVLIGTSSFWEGVDIPGPDLTLVIIPKLPFPVPTDPIINALSNSEGLSTFDDLMLPITILKLKQGIGRLLRTPKDHGSVVILDPRIHRNSYGNKIIKSLPQSVLEIGEVSEMIPAVEQFNSEE